MPPFAPAQISQATIEAEAADLMHAIGQLVRRIRSATSQGLSLTESAVLARLDRCGPATTAELARAEGIKPQSMGATVATLEDAGFLERKPHPTDGRQMLLALTPQGLAIRRSSIDAKHHWLAQAIRQLTEQEQQSLFAAGKILQRLAESDRL